MNLFFKLKDRIMSTKYGVFLTYVVVVFLISLCILLFGKNSNIINWVQVKQEISAQEKQIELLRGQIDEMNRRIETLKSNRDSLETFARERFNFAAPGEDIYLTE